MKGDFVKQMQKKLIICDIRYEYIISPVASKVIYDKTEKK